MITLYTWFPYATWLHYTTWLSCTLWLPSLSYPLSVRLEVLTWVPLPLIVSIQRAKWDWTNKMLANQCVGEAESYTSLLSLSRPFNESGLERLSDTSFRLGFASSPLGIRKFSRPIQKGLDCRKKLSNNHWFLPRNLI